MSKRYATKTLVAATIMSMGLVQTSSAGVEGFIENMYTHTSTNPQVASTQTRGVITGGHLALRTPIRSINLVHISRPNLDMGGCGGIDMWGGSFSHIDSDTAIALMRQVGANALSMAFSVALKNISGIIAETIGKLVDRIEAFNRHFRNTCEIGTMIAKASLGDSEPLRSWGQSLAGTACVESGDGDDQADCESKTEGDPDANARGRDLPVAGNLVWRALNGDEFRDRFDLMNIFDGTEREANEFMMSLTGTHIWCPAGGAEDGDPSAEGRSPPTEMPPLFRLKDLLASKTTADEGQAAPRELRVYRCEDADHADESKQCCRMTERPLDFDGFSELVKRRMDMLSDALVLGDLDALASPANTAFVNATSFPVIYLLNRYPSWPSIRNQMAEILTNAIAEEQLGLFADQVAIISHQLVGGTPFPETERMRDSRAMIMEDARELSRMTLDTMDAVLQVLAYSEAVDKTIFRVSNIPDWRQRRTQ